MFKISVIKDLNILQKKKYPNNSYNYNKRKKLHILFLIKMLTN